MSYENNRFDFGNDDHPSNMPAIPGRAELRSNVRNYTRFQEEQDYSRYAINLDDPASNSSENYVRQSVRIDSKSSSPFPWSRWSRRRQVIAGAVAVVAIGAVFAPTRHAAEGVVVSGVNYASTGIDRLNYNSNLPDPVVSEVSFPSVANPEQSVSGIATYTIDPKKIQQDAKKKVNSIGVQITIDEDKLNQIAPSSAAEQEARKRLLEDPRLYPAYVAHFSNAKETWQCNNDLNKLAGSAIKKANVLVSTPLQRENLSNSENAYIIKFNAIKDDAARYNTFVGLNGGAGQPNLNVPECVVNLSAKK